MRLQPIVAMTAHALDGDAERIKEAGVDHYMTKPLRKAELLAEIEARTPKGKALHPDGGDGGD